MASNTTVRAVPVKNCRIFSNSLILVEISPTGRRSKYFRGKRSRWSIISEPRVMSMRLVVSTNRDVLKKVKIPSKTAITNRKTPRVFRVSGLFCTITLSMITWIIKGLARANNCTKKEAIKTSIKTRLCFLTEGQNHDRPKRCCWVCLVGLSRITSPFSPQDSRNSLVLRLIIPLSGTAIVVSRWLIS